MSDTLELRDVRATLRHRWLVPALLALVTAGLGVVAASNVEPVYRSQGTLLVGPVNGTVIRSTTLRASESLAGFYSDLARRQIVLEPVAQRVGLDLRWDQLRDSVSAVSPSQNPRLITVSVLGASPTQTKQVAEEILRQLVSLSPHAAGGNGQAFVSQQTSQLKATIERAELRVASLNASLARSRNAQLTLDLRLQLTENEKLLNEWRHTYVELNALDLSTDAGGLQVIDDVTTGRTSIAASMVRIGALGGAVGAALGIALVLVLPRRRQPRGPDQPLPADQAEPTPAVLASAETVEPQGAAPVLEPEKGAVASAKLLEVPARADERDEAPVASDAMAAAAPIGRQSGVFDQEKVALSEADPDLVAKADAVRLERVRAAVVAPELDGPPERKVDRGKKGDGARRNGRARRNDTRPGAPEAAPRPGSKAEPGTSSAVSPVQLSFGQSASVPVATPARSDG